MRVSFPRRHPSNAGDTASSFRRWNHFRDPRLPCPQGLHGGLTAHGIRTAFTCTPHEKPHAADIRTRLDGTGEARSASTGFSIKRQRCRSASSAFRHGASHPSGAFLEALKHPGLSAYLLSGSYPGTQSDDPRPGQPLRVGAPLNNRTGYKRSVADLRIPAPFRAHRGNRQRRFGIPPSVCADPCGFC